ncbi:MAG TPA: PIG-L deacetylase family protein [Planctomycetota bacterium]|nr:PIG-L deacetylase family protein [Planctomycetota bacterium]
MSDALRPPDPPTAVRTPPRGPVLVIAPHPDDETMGCGGTLALHARQGDPIHAVFVCSGVQGDPEGYFPRDELPALRQAEARAAAEILGVRRLTFWGFPDNLAEADFAATFGDLPRDPAAQRGALLDGFAAKLALVMDEDRPSVVYYPWSGELNPDHWAAGQAVARLRAARPDLDVAASWLGYDVWTPCPAETVVDVSDVMKVKLAATAVYRTQLLYRDYVPAVRGLDAYRSLFLEAGATFGEGFMGRYREGAS